MNASNPDSHFGSRSHIPPPYVCRGVRLHAFILESDRPKLVALTDAMFSTLSRRQVAYEPVGDNVVLTCGHMQSISSSAAGFQLAGSISESHVGIWIPVRRTAGTGPKYAVFNPYMWVDNPLSLVGGREHFGYAKSWGTLTHHDLGASRGSHNASSRINVTASVLGGNGNEHRTLRPLIEIAPHLDPAESDRPAAGTWESLRCAIDHFAEVVAATTQEILHIEDLLEFVNGWTQGTVPQLFVKRIADISGDSDALLQICTAAITVEEFRGRAIFEDHDLTVHHLDSDPFDTDLGIDTRVLPRGFYVEQMDMTLHTGEVIWDANQPA